MDKTTTAASYAAAVSTAATGYITMQDVAVLVGIVTALGTFALNWYYKVREDKRQQEYYGKSPK